MIRLKEYVPVRMTPEEKVRLRESADVAGLSVSELIRRCCFSRIITSKTDLMMVRELRRLGGLVKHIHNESHGAYSEATAGILRQIQQRIVELSQHDRKEDSESQEIRR